MKLSHNPLKEKITLTENFVIGDFAKDDITYRLDYTGKLNSFQIESLSRVAYGLEVNPDSVADYSIEMASKALEENFSLYVKDGDNWVKFEDEVDIFNLQDIQLIFVILYNKLVEIKENNKKK